MQICITASLPNKYVRKTAFPYSNILKGECFMKRIRLIKIVNMIAFLITIISCNMNLQNISATPALEYYGQCGDTAYWSCNGSVLEIFGAGAVWSEDNLQNLKFSQYSGIKSIVIDEGITEIGNGTFKKCEEVETIEFPQTLEKIGKNAFEACDSLKELRLPENLKFIGADAFSDCKGLESVFVPASIENMENTVFGYCNNLKNVKLENGLKTLGRAMFVCTGIENIRIPDSVKTIEDDVFLSCEQLREITLGSSVNSIGYGAFLNCSSLETVKIFSHVTNDILTNSELGKYYIANEDYTKIMKTSVENMKIISYENSEAERYSVVNRFHFELLKEDINNDGKINSLDLMSMGQFLVGKYTPFEIPDLDGNQVVNVFDLVILSMIVAG